LGNSWKYSNLYLKENLGPHTIFLSLARPHLQAGVAGKDEENRM